VTPFSLLFPISAILPESLHLHTLFYTLITSNLVFSEWNKIFKDPLTTAAAIDRIVHHSIIIEFGKEIKSLRMEAAAQRNQQPLVVSDPEQQAVG
jgi:hypothetical protein